MHWWTRLILNHARGKTVFVDWRIRCGFCCVYMTIRGGRAARGATVYSHVSHPVPPIFRSSRSHVWGVVEVPMALRPN